MNNKELARADPYLAGSIAARGWEWWQEATAEQEADAHGLYAGDRRADFLRGWNAEIADQEQERKKQLITEYDAMGSGYVKGDPAAR